MLGSCLHRSWLEGAELALFQLLFILVLCFGSVDETYRLMVDHRQDTPFHSLPLQFLSQKLWNPSCRLSWQIQILVESVVDGSSTDNLGQSKIFNRDTPVFLDFGRFLFLLLVFRCICQLQMFHLSPYQSSCKSVSKSEPCYCILYTLNYCWNWYEAFSGAGKHSNKWCIIHGTS